MSLSFSFDLSLNEHEMQEDFELYSGEFYNVWMFVFHPHLSFFTMEVNFLKDSLQKS